MKILIKYFCSVLLGVTCLYSQWEQVTGIPDNIWIHHIIESGGYILVSSQNPGVYRSSDNGMTWTQVYSGLPSFGSMTIYNNAVYAIGGNSFYKSTNNGTSWSQVSYFSVGRVTYFSRCGTNLAVGITDFISMANKIYYSSNGGSSWNVSRTIVGAVECMIAIDNIGYACSSGGVYRSTDNGLNFIQVFHYGAFSLSASGNDVYSGQAAYECGRSTDNGVDWEIINTPYNGIVWAITSVNNTVITGSSSGAFISTNKGTTWDNYNQGFTVVPEIRTFLIKDSSIFAGTFNKSLWKRTDNLLGVLLNSSVIPKVYNLYNNYPNPFNPQTKIKFAVPKASFTRLIIYDLLGRVVATLVNEELKPGTYEADWDGTNYSSGVYFYKIISGVFVETKKMVLMK